MMSLRWWGKSHTIRSTSLTYTLPHAELAQPNDSILKFYKQQFFRDKTWGGDEGSRYNGECPKNRFMKTASGEAGLNYLCKGYYHFFKHAAPYMDYMRNELLAGRTPSNVKFDFQS